MCQSIESVPIDESGDKQDFDVTTSNLEILFIKVDPLIYLLLIIRYPHRQLIDFFRYLEFCYDGERKYKPGDRFITEKCDGSCVCGPGGSMSCVSLCPPVNIKCDTDEVKINSLRKIANSNCTCSETKCVKRNIKGQSHQNINYQVLYFNNHSHENCANALCYHKTCYCIIIILS